MYNRCFSSIFWRAELSQSAFPSVVSDFYYPDTHSDSRPADQDPAGRLRPFDVYYFQGHRYSGLPKRHGIRAAGDCHRGCKGVQRNSFSLALVITSVIAGYLFLETGWKRVILVLSIFPVMIIKNAVRITTLSLLAVYVDESWLTDSFLHHSGGIFFFLLALVILAPVLLFLKKTEKDQEKGERLKVKGSIPAS